MNDQKQQPRQLQITTGDEISRARFSNNMYVAHSPEEFMIDWLLNSPSGTHLVSRIIITPGHMKRIIAALTDNLQKYEQKFGTIKTTEPGEQKFH
jgi:hypothetical protein